MSIKDLKILIVEDDENFSLLIKMYLKKMGFQFIVEADGGMTALQKLQMEKFDLIISDLNMPGLDGVEFFNSIQAQEDLKHIPFLLITAEGMTERYREMLGSDIVNFLLKPFPEAHLKAKVRQILELDEL
jgi:two-component system, chemotaxis family, chemotaxis protein CheY